MCPDVSVECGTVVTFQPAYGASGGLGGGDSDDSYAAAANGRCRIGLHDYFWLECSIEIITGASEKKNPKYVDIYKKQTFKKWR